MIFTRLLPETQERENVFYNSVQLLSSMVFRNRGTLLQKIGYLSTKGTGKIKLLIRTPLLIINHYDLIHTAFYSYIHRLISILMSSNDFKIKLNWIKQVVYNNGYDPIIIDRLLYKKQLWKAINYVFPRSHSKLKKLLPSGNIHRPSLRISC